MSGDEWQGVPDLLSRLEDLELPLLSWGVVDGYLNQDEVERAIEAQLDVDHAAKRPYLDVKDYLDHLLERRLLIRLPESEPRYRTRLAETLRMLRHLRQLFPGSEGTAFWWRQFSPLVSDYRIRVAPRRYPHRAHGADDVIAKFADLAGWDDRKAQVVRRMVGERKLADFQVSATRSVLSSLEHLDASATIVTAGTGSGKTLAFYLPALIDIAASASTKRLSPHTLALYPRNELLRDQAREAMRVVETIGPLTGGNSRRGRIGMLYGLTPSQKELGRSSDLAQKKWRRTSDAWITPYFPCLDDRCLGDLSWTDQDRLAGTERLTCVQCRRQTPPGAIALTRDSIRSSPPDILFTSTEMLSKHSTTHLAKVLGWGGKSGIRLVLLDEVHTYAGVHGAQVAMMLRRWRYASRRNGGTNPVFVGLSATLRNAGDFMANLTGIERPSVTLVSPAPSEMRPTSREYGVVLRGDPVSGASLLSTTIQTTMLITRVLDNRPGIYGSTTFAFTDNLDVINRLYDNLRDAEGQAPWGKTRGRVLADLRAPEHLHSYERYLDGQSWDLPQALGRLTGRHLKLGRVSSQDTGVDGGADVIVATSSLEVGFNDPRVGAVIQHKAPRDMASFLQRRGRAGRNLAMRPLTAVVLSDYGRDRIAYQSYERLLDPEIGARTLPVGNRFVIKIQATHALLDWIYRRTGTDARWLLRPPHNGQKYDDQRRIAQATDLLVRLLDSSDVQRDLALHLQTSLQISADEADAALWEEPRSILLSVVPTALRRLESQWTPLLNEVDPSSQSGEPLPEFMTATLFDALNVPDVIFSLPFQGESPSMAIAQALREAVPGRVSKRFGHERTDHRTWLAVPSDGSELPLSQIVAKGHSLGVRKMSDGTDLVVVRPLVMRLAKPDDAVADSSSARPRWDSVFGYEDSSVLPVDLPHKSVWASFIDSCAFALHVAGEPMRVLRATRGAEGERLINESPRGGRPQWTTRRTDVRYVHEGQNAALGYELDVDGLVIDGDLAKLDHTLLDGSAQSVAWRTAAFRQLVREDQRLDGIVNVFQRDWLTAAYLHSYVSQGLDADDAAGIGEKLIDGRWAAGMEGFLAATYRSEITENEGGRLLDALRPLALDSMVQAVIEGHAKILTSTDPRTATDSLLDRVFADTLGCAVLTAALERVPDAQDDDLTVDIEIDTTTRKFRIYVTETSLGGLGLLESLHREYVADPRVFWDAVGRACGPTEAEDVDAAMQALVTDLKSRESTFKPVVQAYRRATGVAEMDAALSEFIQQWTEREGPPSHLLVSTIASRMLRPGSKASTDQVLGDLVAVWTATEQRLGVEVDPRTIVFHAVKGNLGIQHQGLSQDMLYSMLWARGDVARRQRLEHWHPFRANVLAERSVVAGLIDDHAVSIDVVASEWLDDFATAMERDGRADLVAAYRDRERLGSAMREAMVTPLDRDGLRVYGRVVSVDQHGGRIRAHIALAEELQ